MTINPNTHFYLYAKGWYVVGDQETDLKFIMGHYARIEPRFVDMRDVKNHLLGLVYYDITRRGNELETFRYFTNLCLEKGIIKASMALLCTSVTSGLSIGKPDSNILLIAEASQWTMNDPIYKWAE